MTPDIGLANWFRERSVRTPERRALHFEGRDWSYGAMQRAIEDCAGRLAAIGIGKGDRVAFLGANQPMFLFAMFASARLGAIFVPLNFRLTGPELAFMIDDCAASALIVDAAHRPVIEPQLARLASLEATLAAEDEAGWIEGPPPVPSQIRALEDDVALIMYTSGTTGRPKGAMLTHGNLWWNNASAMHAMDVLANDVTLVHAPIFHIGGLNVTMLAALQKGALVVLSRAFDPGRALADIAAHKVTTMFGVPAMFLFMAQAPGFAEADLSSLRLLVVGGAPCPVPVLNVWLARGVMMQQGYGLTETSPMVSILSPEYALAKIGSSGRTPMFVEVRIVDSVGRELTAPGEQGEILVRGPNVTKGYWGLPDATAMAIDGDGWFRTGDAGFFDADGFLTISDRIKDMIITGGENVYPAEIESQLMRHPAIAEVGVIGEPDPQWGEKVVAVVALKPGETLTLEALRAFAEQSLAHYKLPKRLELVTALPRNATGKILKRQLRQTFGQAGRAAAQQ
ncbi:fatty-acyl-CoA synthase [Roseiarcus fermentans]|uniref:3-methylmercaptopropionyl-CoA ligase n=1 Tax=Roseiarcus fermentans TaxID=1473586 RepID=A0A366EKM4_9HYPH|nr:long-chain fatty acid--CoA ligase [Roseiarcus fermentans]RBP02884.1 fatty-acyl-CoA synthase [Roseiarcus fermentans]